MTALQAAFARAGGPSPMLAEFQVALSQIVESYRNRGLPSASIASALEGAAQSFHRKVDVGQPRAAHQGHAKGADDFSPGDGPKDRAGDGQTVSAALGDSPFAGSEGQTRFADEAMPAVPPSGESHSTQLALAALSSMIAAGVGGGPFTPSNMLVGGQNSRSVDRLSGADNGHGHDVPLREPTPTEAGRVLRALPRAPGSGAMGAAAIAARHAVRGESWLLTYQIPNGRDVLSMRIGELLPTYRRMVRDGAGYARAAVVLRRLHDETQKLGQVSPDQIVGKTLPPAVIDRVSQELTPERIIDEAAKWGRKFVEERAALAGGNL